MEGRINVNLPSVPLKIVVSVHFILTIWGDQIGWLPGTYLFCNLLVLALGVWAIAVPENSDATQLFLLGMLFTILNDIIVIAIYYTVYPPFQNKSHYRFCVGMAILSLILKPLSCLFIFQENRSRGGELMQKWSPGNPYVTIEGHDSATHPHGGYAPGQPSAPQM